MATEDKLGQLMQLGSYFLSGVLAINASQVLGAPLYLVNQDWYNAWIAFTKQSFSLLTVTLTQWFNPTTVRVSGDASMRGQLFKRVDDNLLCNFPERMVLISNHQIYTDWLYLWWVAYCGGMHGRIYIILKESLRRIPVIGWGIQLSQFILLKRNWDKDKVNLSKHLQKLNNITDPMWLLLFPEGTNLAPSTRAASRKWAAKNNIKDMQHTLLPRTTGLQFCLQELRRTVGYVYDCTIAYEGVPRGQYAQDIYTLKAQYVDGRSPKCIHMYWRRFRISDIPIDNEKSFDSWLRARWAEKDAYIEYFYRTGHFPCDTGISKMKDGSLRKGAGYIVTTIRATQWHEFLQVFVPIGLLSLVLYTFYGELPQQVMKALKSGGEKAVVKSAQNVTSQFGAAPKTITTYPGGPTITINSEKVDPKQAAQLLQKVTKHVDSSGSDPLVSALPKNASVSNQLSGVNSVRTTAGPSMQRPAVSGRAVSTVSSGGPSTISRRPSLVSHPTAPSVAGGRSIGSSTAWETMTNASIKSIPKLAPKALQKPLPNPATAARQPSLAAKPVIKKSVTPIRAQQAQAGNKPVVPTAKGTAQTPAKTAAKMPAAVPNKAPVKAPAAKPAATKPVTKPAIAKPANQGEIKAPMHKTSPSTAPKTPVKSAVKATPAKLAAGKRA